jgi:DNA-binding CsgD family transcriptional regulator
MTTRMKYPSMGQREILARWTREGAESLAGADPERRHVRAESMDALRGLGRRMDLSRDWRDRLERTSAYGVPFSRLLTEDMRVHAYVALRSRGLVLPGGKSVTPWTAMQARAVWLSSLGLTQARIAGEMTLSTSTINSLMIRMRKQYACVTTAEMVGFAYRRSWLPTDAERARLMDADPMKRPAP